MKHLDANHVKALLGEQFLKGVNSIAYGTDKLRMYMNSNENNVMRMTIYIQDNGAFAVEEIYATRNKQKRMLNDRMYTDVHCFELGAFVLGLVGGFKVNK